MWASLTGANQNTMLATAAAGPVNYTGATINPGSAGNGIMDLQYDGTVTDIGTLTLKTTYGGTDYTITSYSAVIHTDDTIVRVTLTGDTKTWQDSHGIKVSNDGSGNIAAHTDTTTLTNNSTVDLPTKIDEWWKLDDAANSTRVAQVTTPTNDLSDVNNVAQGTVGAGTAVIVNSCNFDGSDTVEGGDVLDPPANGKFSMACWFRIGTLPSARAGTPAAYLMAKWNGTTDRSYTFQVQSADKLIATGNNSSNDSFYRRHDDKGALSASTWYFAGVIFDPTDTGNEIRLCIGTKDLDDLAWETSAIGGAGAGNPQCKTSGALFSLGACATAVSWSTLLGQEDAPQWFGEAITVAEMADLYNKGVPKQPGYLPT